MLIRFYFYSFESTLSWSLTLISTTKSWLRWRVSPTATQKYLTQKAKACPALQIFTFATPETKQNCPSAAAVARSLTFLGIVALEHKHRSTQCLRLTPKSKINYETNVKICSHPSHRLKNLTTQL